jgi:FtsH-binding integral membrane protein
MSYFTREINWAAIGKTAPISPRVQTHLTQVYTVLSISLLFAAFGVLFFMKFHIGGTLAFIASLAAMIWLAATPKQEFLLRTGILCLFSFLTGMNIGPLINLALEVDPAIISSAFLGTVCIFACFSASSYFATRRSYLYLGALLSSALTIFVFLGFLNIFFRSIFIFNILLYGGLLVFCAYVMFDTQLIIEKASSGYYDVVWDALELFLDFVAIFIRLVIILLKNKKKEN